MPTRRVLFAIRDPEAPRQPGLAKAIQVARALGASLELFHALTHSLLIDFGRYEPDAVDALRERMEGPVRVHLARLCNVVREHAVTASCSAEWDYPPHEAVVRRATAIGAELIIAECHKGARTRPWLVHLTDWELLRTSPVPVLLIKNGRPYHRPVVMAAVDPSHAHAKPAALDRRIVDTAEELSRGLRGSLHIMHASYPSIVGADVGAATRRATSAWATLTFEELQDQERRTFEEFRAAAGIPRRRAHLVDGNPVSAIPELAQVLEAGIVAMGALSRSSLRRVFIGNTAERILGTLPCDVLVVKPEKAAARVATRTRGLRVAASLASMVS